MTSHPALRPLQRGDRVALISTSIPPTPDLVDESLAILDAWGLDPVLGKHALDRHPRAAYLAGLDKDRAQDLTDAWLDDSIDAIFCLRGGYGTLRLVDYLDPEQLRKAKPKPLIGSSDLTGVHEYWEQHLGVPTWFAPMFATFDLLRSTHNVEKLHEAVFGDYHNAALTSPDAVTVQGGTVEGTLTGGTLSLIRQARGMNLFPPETQNADGKIVLLEDVSEEPWRLDGQLLTLVRSGYFDGVAGIGLGTWEKCGDPEQVMFVLEEYLKPLGVPIVAGLPFGHGKQVQPVPLGVRARLIAEGDNPRIEIVDG